MGRDGLEPSASALSEQCSNQLSYRPVTCQASAKRGGTSLSVAAVSKRCQWNSRLTLTPLSHS